MRPCFPCPQLATALQIAPAPANFRLSSNAGCGVHRGSPPRAAAAAPLIGGWLTELRAILPKLQDSPWRAGSLLEARRVGPQLGHSPRLVTSSKYPLLADMGCPSTKCASFDTIYSYRFSYRLSNVVFGKMSGGARSKWEFQFTSFSKWNPGGRILSSVRRETLRVRRRLAGVPEIWGETNMGKDKRIKR